MFVWTHQDPRGFDAANAQAIARCAAGAWGTDVVNVSSGTRSEDLLILVARSLLIREVIVAAGDQKAIAALVPTGSRLPINVIQGSWGSPNVDVDHENAQYILLRTWEALARSEGWTEGQSAQLSATSGKPVDVSSGGAQSNVVAIIAIVVGIVALAALIAFVVYNVNNIIDRDLARHAQGQELMRAHADCQKMLEDHAAAERAAGHPIPFSLAELSIMQRLARLQDQIMTSWTSTTTGDALGNPPGKPKTWPDVVGDTLALALVLTFGYFLFRKEI